MLVISLKKRNNISINDEIICNDPSCCKTVIKLFCPALSIKIYWDRSLSPISTDIFVAIAKTFKPSTQIG